VTKKLLTRMVDEDKETISLFYGKDVLEEDAEKLTNQLQEEYPDCDVQLYQGGQPLYYYIISVE
jgi:dihydroxyacetone kinase-like predicted kinase